MGFIVLNAKLINLLKIDKNQTIILEDAVEFSDYSKKILKQKKIYLFIVAALSQEKG